MRGFFMPKLLTIEPWGLEIDPRWPKLSTQWTGVLTTCLLRPHHELTGGCQNGNHRVFKSFSSNLEMQ